jgi:16S rRNA (uracil1498-N3)-methyltransferase
MILVAWEEEHALPLSRAVQAYVADHGTPEKVLIVIGPEGGISPEEKARLDEIGAQSVTLGKRILRTETAGLCALAALWTALGEM